MFFSTSESISIQISKRRNHLDISKLAHINITYKTHYNLHKFIYLKKEAFRDVHIIRLKLKIFLIYNVIQTAVFCP